MAAAAWKIADSSAGHQQHYRLLAAGASAAVVLATCAARRCRPDCCEANAGAAAGDLSSPRQPSAGTPTRSTVSTPSCTHTPARRLQLNGSATERGRRLGKELRDEVKEVLTAWRLELFSRFVGDNPTSAPSDNAAVESWAGHFVANFLASTEYSCTDTLNRWVPEIVEELRGLADSAGVSYDDLLCMQYRAECDKYGALNFGGGGWRQREEITTSMAVCGVRRLGFPALLAQSVEFEPSRCRHETIVEMATGPAAGGQPQPSQLFLAHAGMIAPLSGINTCGVAVVADLLPQLVCSVISGGICAGFAVRAALAQTTFEDAIHVRRTSHTSLGIFAHAHSDCDCQARGTSTKQSFGT